MQSDQPDTPLDSKPGAARPTLAPARACKVAFLATRLDADVRALAEEQI
jgi:hypothetical protein